MSHQSNLLCYHITFIVDSKYNTVYVNHPALFLVFGKLLTYLILKKSINISFVEAYYVQGISVEGQVLTILKFVYIINRERSQRQQ